MTPSGDSVRPDTSDETEEVSKGVTPVTRHHIWSRGRHRRALRHEDHPVPHDLPVGPLADRRSEPGGTPGHRHPVACETECAHLLANEARETLHRYGLDDAEILDLADDFIAEDRGAETEDFEGWAIFQHSMRARQLTG